MSIVEDVKTRAAARVGTIVARKYRIDALLGMGGMGSVYSATHRNGSRVALKLLHTELSRNEAIRTRFLREGYAANRVGHPGVVKVLDEDVADTGEAFLVLELLEGETLGSRWERAGQRLPLLEVAQHVDRTLDVLAAAHENGVVHRDMKPENVVLTKLGELKLMDFGIARLLDGTGATRSGDLMGTPAFMPPEQANGRARDVDGQSDLWATGAMMFTLLTGYEVHEARTSVQQLVYAASMAAPRVSHRAPSLPSDVAHVLDVALAFEKSHRWMSARAMRTALRHAMAASTSTSAKIQQAPALRGSAATAALVQAPTILAGEPEEPAPSRGTGQGRTKS